MSEVWVTCARPDCSGHLGRNGSSGILLTRRDANNRPTHVVLHQRTLPRGKWAIPGGVIDARGGRVETARSAALREAAEEIGLPRDATSGPDPLVVVREEIVTLDHGAWQYTTIVADVTRGFTPRITDRLEGLNVEWVAVSDVAGRNLLQAFRDAWPVLVRRIYGLSGPAVAPGPAGGVGGPSNPPPGPRPPPRNANRPTPGPGPNPGSQPPPAQGQPSRRSNQPTSGIQPPPRNDMIQPNPRPRDPHSNGQTAPGPGPNTPGPRLAVGQRLTPPASGPISTPDNNSRSTDGPSGPSPLPPPPPIPPIPAIPASPPTLANGAITAQRDGDSDNPTSGATPRRLIVNINIRRGR